MFEFYHKKATNKTITYKGYKLSFKFVYTSDNFLLGNYKKRAKAKF